MFAAAIRGSVAVIRVMVSKIIVPDNFAFCYNVIIIAIMLMDNFIFVYNVMPVFNDMFMPYNLLSFTAVKFFGDNWFAVVFSISDNRFIIILPANRFAIILPFPFSITSVTKTHIFHV